MEDYPADWNSLRGDVLTALYISESMKCRDVSFFFRCYYCWNSVPSRDDNDGKTSRRNQREGILREHTLYLSLIMSETVDRSKHWNIVSFGIM